jgi:transposase
MLQALNREIQRADKSVETIVRKDATVRRLCSVPGVGPITAASFVATLDTAARFAGPHQVYVDLARKVRPGP